MRREKVVQQALQATSSCGNVELGYRAEPTRDLCIAPEQVHRSAPLHRAGDVDCPSG